MLCNSPKKHILVMTWQQKVDLVEVYTQTVQDQETTPILILQGAIL